MQSKVANLKTKHVASNLTHKTAYRVFLSHKTEVKKQTAALKESLKLYGIASFVAHEDIAPTKEWQNEIETALESMDAFVWTDQEVG